jgi:hypothetical protein
MLSFDDQFDHPTKHLIVDSSLNLSASSTGGSGGGGSRVVVSDYHAAAAAAASARGQGTSYSPLSSSSRLFKGD